MSAPESPEVVGARARARVAAMTPRRPVAVLVVSPVIRREQTPAMMPPPPQRYTPVSLAAAPFVPWDDPAAGLALAAALAGIVAAVEGAQGEVSAIGAGRPGAVEWDADRYVSGAR